MFFFALQCLAEGVLGSPPPGREDRELLCSFIQAEQAELQARTIPCRASWTSSIGSCLRSTTRPCVGCLRRRQRKTWRIGSLALARWMSSRPWHLPRGSRAITLFEGVSTWLCSLFFQAGGLCLPPRQNDRSLPLSGDIGLPYLAFGLPLVRHVCM